MGNTEPKIPDTIYDHSTDIEWQPTKNPKLWMKLLYENEASGDKTYLMKADAGAYAGSHDHDTVEQLFVLEGEFSDQRRVVKAGDYVRRQPGVKHEFKSDGGAVILVILSN